MIEEYRRCRRCDVLQPIREFYQHSRNSAGRMHICRTCTKASAKRWRDENRERFIELRWRREIKTKYGITADDYERMLSEQDGRCAGCGSDSPGPRYGRVFNIDHCHRTGRVRGLLCDDCNLALGRMNEDGDKLRSLAVYADERCFG